MNFDYTGNGNKDCGKPARGEEQNAQIVMTLSAKGAREPIQSVEPDKYAR
jgi:hypothetical protein